MWFTVTVVLVAFLAGWLIGPKVAAWVKVSLAKWDGQP